MKIQQRAPEWEQLPWPELLAVRLCDLGLQIRGTPLAAYRQKLFAELAARGLKFRPHIYLGDEWFSPEGIAAIAAPFYLAHPKLCALEKKIMGEAEGATEAECLKLLRHEAGHCFDHLFKFSRQAEWKKYFGSPRVAYHPEDYRANLRSQCFVQNLKDGYAQAHPDEDFAETFAVWLKNLHWKRRYRAWPVALAKLNFVDELVQSVRDRATPRPKICEPFSVAEAKITLGAFYRRRRNSTPVPFAGKLKWFSWEGDR